MFSSSVTVSLVHAARGGPFVFHDDLRVACETAQSLGFDAIELFAPGPDIIEPAALQAFLTTHQLKLSGVGTGAGWLMHQWSLASPDPAVRRHAFEFIRSMIDFGGQFSAPAIIGSMQGRAAGEVSRATALGWLGEAVARLAEHAVQYDVPLLYEPLNRYETNLCNTQAEGVRLLESAGATNARLLADLFHMNIEETSIPQGLREGGQSIGHVHFVDSNRRPAGHGHLRYEEIAPVLREIGYSGYLSAEALPYPDSPTAAATTIAAYREFLTLAQPQVH